MVWRIIIKGCEHCQTIARCYLEVQINKYGRERSRVNKGGIWYRLRTR
jgi:hypothetical protein